VCQAGGRKLGGFLPEESEFTSLQEPAGERAQDEGAVAINDMSGAEFLKRP